MRIDDQRVKRMPINVVKDFVECRPTDDELDTYNEGCGCTCRECQEWHKELTEKQKL